MEIKKFNSIKENLNNKDFTRENIIEYITNNIIYNNIKLFNMRLDGSTYGENDETLQLYFSNNNGEETIVKLDFSDIGIEIGSKIWDDDRDDLGEFIPELNLDNEITKEYKKTKKNSNKYNM